MDHKIYTYISDGGIQEEISQGAGRIAGTLGLDNLIMFYDSNDIQLSTETSVVTSEDTAAKYRAWDWNVYEIDGNDVDQIRAALSMAQIANGKPTLIIGKCIQFCKSIIIIVPACHNKFADINVIGIFHMRSRLFSWNKAYV